MHDLLKVHFWSEATAFKALCDETASGEKTVIQRDPFYDIRYKEYLLWVVSQKCKEMEQ
jgi:hypothetical protein